MGEGTQSTQEIFLACVIFLSIPLALAFPIVLAMFFRILEANGRTGRFLIRAIPAILLIAFCLVLVLVAFSISTFSEV